MLKERKLRPADALRTIAPWNKGLGHLKQGLATADIARLGWNLLREDLSLPCAVLYDERLQHNLTWMQQFIAAYGLKLAPHGKTTMAPRLFEMQLGAGAWGITLATAHQTLVAYLHGVRRVLMANQLVGRENMAIIGRLLRIRSLSSIVLLIRRRRLSSWARFSRSVGSGCACCLSWACRAAALACAMRSSCRRFWRRCCGGAVRLL